MLVKNVNAKKGFPSLGFNLDGIYAPEFLVSSRNSHSQVIKESKGEKAWDRKAAKKKKR